jgi:hypothetical protein
VHKQTKPAIETEIQLTDEESEILDKMMADEPADKAEPPYLEWMRAEADRARRKHSATA